MKETRAVKSTRSALLQAQLVEKTVCWINEVVLAMDKKVVLAMDKQLCWPRINEVVLAMDKESCVGHG